LGWPGRRQVLILSTEQRLLLAEQANTNPEKAGFMPAFLFAVSKSADRPDFPDFINPAP
jgi:hypothetical protein